jgi:hypothetical protein
MKSCSKNHLLFSGLLLIMASLAIPQLSSAQRFSHGGFGGGGGRAAAPAPRQAAPMRQEVSRPSPAVVRPAERPPVQENRVTINGGSRNVGNHDFRANTTVTARVNTNVRQNVNVRENIYHTGGDRGAHPYYFHPYHPYYWGPRWHPVGFFLGALAANAIRLSIAGQYYYYDDGCYYLPSNGGYSVVPPPVGAVVSYLPDGYETTMVGNDTFYYYGGAFYINTGQGYQVVVAPPGAVVTQIPVGAIDQNINGEDLLVYNNTYYQPISQDGQDAYEVVQVN